MKSQPPLYINTDNAKILTKAQQFERNERKQFCSLVTKTILNVCHGLLKNRGQQPLKRISELILGSSDQCVGRHKHCCTCMHKLTIDLFAKRLHWKYWRYYNANNGHHRKLGQPVYIETFQICFLDFSDNYVRLFCTTVT